MTAAARAMPQRKAAKPRWRGRDAHERQAEASASGFVAGRGQLQHGLTAAPAASHVVDGSAPSMLPSGLAGQLESAFGADLSALRIHRDAPAHAAAAAIGSRAFTSGTAIYFARGAWDPSHVGGQRLIAHEVSHAIQQTGRAAHGGVRLEPGAAGHAGVQREEDINKRVAEAHDRYTDAIDTADLFANLKLLDPETGKDACLKVIERHLASPARAAVSEQATQLRQTLVGHDDSTVAAALDASFAAIPKGERSDEVKALFYDCFKAAGAGARAIAIVEGNIPKHTAFGSWSFYEKHLRRDGSWAVATLRSNKAVRRYVFETVVAFARLDYYGLLRGPLDIDAQGKFGSNMRDAIEEALRYDPLMANERMVAALRALVQFEQVRRMPFQAMEQALAGDKSALARLGKKRILVDQFRQPEFLATIAKTMDNEVVAIASAAGTALAPVAESAALFWDAVVKEGAKLVPQDEKDYAGQELARDLMEMLREKLSNDGGLAGIRKKLIGALRIATQPERQGLPGVATLRANRGQAADRMMDATLDLDRLIVARQVAAEKVAEKGGDTASFKPPNEKTIMAQTALGLLYTNMVVLIGRLRMDPSLKGLDTSQRPDDLAAVLYSATTRIFRAAGVNFGFKDLADASEKLEAKWRGGYIALLGPFTEDKNITIAQFTADFPTGVAGNMPFTSGFVGAVTAIYYEGLLKNLEDTLNEKIGDKKREFIYQIDEQHKPILNTAIKLTENADTHPRRFRVPKEQTILLPAPGERNDIVGLLLRTNHPQFKLFLEQKPPDDFAFAPQEMSAHLDGLVAWLIPGVSRIANRIATLPGVTHLINAQGNELGAPASYPGGPYQWLLALGVIARTKQSLQKQIDDALHQWAVGAFANLDTPLRRTTNNLRRTLGPQIEQLLGEFNASVNSKGYFENPRTILKWMLEFAGAVRPPGTGEQQRQVAALMLEIAPTLNDRLNGTGRLDIILPFYKPVLNAAKYALVPANAKTMTGMDLAFSQDQIASRAQTLKSLAEAFEKSATSQRGERVLHGDPASGRVFVPGRPYPLQVRKTDNDDDDADDMLRGTDYGQRRRPVMYKLVAVHKAFAFEPPLGERDGPAGTAGNSKLTIEGKPAGPEPVDLLTIIMTGDGNDRQIVVTSTDTDQLKHLFYSLDMKITMAELQDLGDALEVFADVIVTAIQILFPEFAPEIAYAQMAGSIVQFFGGPEYEFVKSLLSGDIGEAFSKGYEELKKQLTPEAFWDYLLFQDIALPAGLNELKKVLGGIVDLSSSMGSVNRRKEPGTRSAIGSVFTGIAQFGSSILGAVMGVHEHIAPPVRKFELFVEGHPVLALMLQFIAQHLAELATMSLDELGVTAVDELTKPVDEMFLRANNFLDKLGDFELPKELVPLEAIVLMIVNFIIDRLPAKYRVPLRTAEGTGPGQDLFNWIAGKVAAKLKDAGIDPNIIWQETAKRELDPIVKDASQSIADGIRELIGKILPKGMTLRTLTVQGLASSVFDEAQPAADGGGAVPTGPARLPVDEGKALPRADRARSERGMGHDFGHVRLHRGGRVDSALRSSGARAATAGSHVFLDSGVNTGAADGRDTLSHELAHVLQQGGPRPLGESHSSRPRAPTAGAGGGRWRVDPGAESQADRLAAQAREPAAAPRPVTPHQGVQPKLTDFVARFFAKMSNAEQLHEQAAKLGSTTVDETKLKAVVPHLRDHLGNDLVNAFAKKELLTVEPPFAVARPDIVTFVTGAAKQEILDGMDGVLMTAVADVKKKGAKKTDKKEDRTAPILRADWLETRLEEFLFGVTGMSIDLELNRTDKETGPDGKKYHAINATDPIKSLKVNYIHFPFLHGGTNLWQHLMTTAYPALKGAARTNQASRVRLVLGGMRIDTSLFDGRGKALNLSAKAKKLIEDYVDLAKGEEIPGDLAPRWSEYLNTKRDPKQNLPYGQVGLRLGNHGEMIKNGPKYGKERDSHHTVQYLLVEYLNNQKSGYQPFPVKGSADPTKNLYPGVTFDPSGKAVSEIASQPGGDKKIQIGTFIDGARGAEMPTLLLSRFAHKKGRVHLTPEADDESSDPPSQGQAVHRRFTDALGPYAAVVKSATLLKAIKDGTSTPGLPARATPDKLAAAIFDAALTTYRSVRDDMNSKLGMALDREETAYYKALVARATDTRIYNEKPQRGYEPTSSASSAVMATLKKAQADTLESKFGFGNSKRGG